MSQRECAGFNAPRCDLMAVMRPTKSAALYVQIMGRGMRKFPGKKDCLVLDSLEVREPGDEDWAERLCVRGFTSKSGSWESWRVSEGDTRLVRSTGSPLDDVATFEGIDPVTGRTGYITRGAEAPTCVLAEVRARRDFDRCLL